MKKASAKQGEAALRELLKARPEIAQKILRLLKVERLDDDRIYQTIGERVRAAREREGLSQGDLAELLGMTRTSITNVEAGRQRIPIHVLYRLAASLDDQVENLLP